MAGPGLGSEGAGSEVLEARDVVVRFGGLTAIDGVSVDLLATSGADAFLERSLARPVQGEIPVVPAGVLIYLKLRSPRLKDRADVVELVKAGLDVAGVRQYLEQEAPALAARFEECIAQARAEE